jgi:hypothetical protein
MWDVIAKYRTTESVMGLAQHSCTVVYEEEGDNLWESIEFMECLVK